MADITAIQHTGESAMYDTETVWMPDHVWHVISSLCPTLFTVSSLQVDIANAKLQWQLSAKAVHDGGTQLLRQVYLDGSQCNAQSKVTCMLQWMN